MTRTKYGTHFENDHDPFFVKSDPTVLERQTRSVNEAIFYSTRCSISQFSFAFLETVQSQDVQNEHLVEWKKVPSLKFDLYLPFFVEGVARQLEEYDIQKQIFQMFAKVRTSCFTLAGVRF